MFSRIASQLHADTNPLYRLRDELLAQGNRIVDLVSGNVNEHGIVFPPELLEQVLIAAAPQCRIYSPDSFGQRLAREAIAGYYAAHGISIPADRVLLTPGTSISYWYSFKLLADEGDEILCPSPSYPLFDYIAALSGVRLIPYRLRERDGWQIDLEHLEASLSTRTRAVALISPHNPTGHVSSTEELAALASIAARHDLAIISDEVFSEFLLAPEPLPRPASFPAPLVLTLNGFSKMYALPGLKLGWMGVSGEEGKVRQALRALEIISDTFLPVNEVVQAAVPGIMEAGGPFVREYSAEISRRWADAGFILGNCSGIEFVPPRGGFYVTLRLARLAEDDAAERLLRKEGLLVHPGHFYDIPPHHVVLSFVQEPQLIQTAYGRLAAALGISSV
jgi:alanine-synthesizing transaminase